MVHRIPHKDKDPEIIRKRPDEQNNDTREEKEE